MQTKKLERIDQILLCKNVDQREIDAPMILQKECYNPFYQSLILKIMIIINIDLPFQPKCRRLATIVHPMQLVSHDHIIEDDLLTNNIVLTETKIIFLKKQTFFQPFILLCLRCSKFVSRKFFHQSQLSGIFTTIEC